MVALGLARGGRTYVTGSGKAEARALERKRVASPLRSAAKGAAEKWSMAEGCPCAGGANGASSGGVGGEAGTVVAHTRVCPCAGGANGASNGGVGCGGFSAGSWLACMSHVLDGW